MKPTLYILCGIPFSGKSTLSKAIVKETDFIRIDLDEIKFQMFGKDIKDEEIDQVGWDKIYQEMYKQIKLTLQGGKSVLHDTGNFTKHERSLVRKIADELGLPSKTIYVNVPYKVAKERWLKNKETKERFDISTEAFESAVAEMEIPTEEEQVIEYTPVGGDPKGWVHTHIWSNSASLIKGHVHYEEYINPNDWDNLYGPELQGYSARNFKGFVAILYYLLKEKGLKFDILLGGGDSGLAMAKFAELVYKTLDIPAPKSIIIPIKRYKNTEMYWSDNPDDFYDNSSLLPEIKEQLKDIKTVRNILYVDDEISYLGLTVKACTSLVLSAMRIEQKPSLTIVAENQGLEWKENNPKVDVNFYQWSSSVEKLYGAIFYLIPSELGQELKSFADMEKDVKLQVNLLLGLPIKNLEDGKQEFSYNLLETVKQKVPNLDQLQKEFMLYIEKLIKEGIDEYNSKKIQIII